jgi:hypothetical protein
MRYGRGNPFLWTLKAVVAKHAGFVSSTAGRTPSDKQRSGRIPYRAM